MVRRQQLRGRGWAGLGLRIRETTRWQDIYMPSPNRRKETGWHSLTPNLARKGSPEGSFLPWREQESTTTSKRDQQVLWETASFPMVLRLPCPIRGHWCIRAAPVKGILPQKEVRSLRKPLCPHGPETPLSHQEDQQAQPHFRSSPSRKLLLFRA